MEKRVVVVGQQSDHRITFLLRGEVAPRISVSPQLLNIAPKSALEYEVALQLNFDDQFMIEQVPKLVEAGSAFQIKGVEFDSAKQVKFRLVIRQEDTNWDTRPSIVKVTVTMSDQTNLPIEIPIVWQSAPKILPPIIRSQSNGSYQFFVVGDFGHDLSILKTAKLFVSIDGKQFPLEAEWKGERTCKCTLVYDGKSDQIMEKIATLKIETSRSVSSELVGEFTIITTTH